jgi:hypothetical protein
VRGKSILDSLAGGMESKTVFPSGATHRQTRAVLWRSDACQVAALGLQLRFAESLWFGKDGRQPFLYARTGQRRVRCGLPVICPEPRNLESLVSTPFGECLGDFALI